MSATNKTTYYELPIFIGTDVPSWLGDWNNAMNAIDSALNTVKTSADSATNIANTAEGKSDANTESINALNAEIQTLKAAVQNYDAILNFNPVNLAINPNNLNAGSAAFMVQNTNKTLNKLYFSCVIKNSISNPVVYNYTEEGGATTNFIELFTVEDNCFNLNQSSLPNYQTALTLGLLTFYSSDGETSASNYIRAWYDGATTHFGWSTGRQITSLAGNICYGNITVFLSGSVYNPDTPSGD